MWDKIKAWSGWAKIGAFFKDFFVGNGSAPVLSLGFVLGVIAVAIGHIVWGIVLIIAGLIFADWIIRRLND